MPRGKANYNRNSKVTFLRSPYEEGQRLDLPLKLKYSNIIEHNSLPKCRGKERTRRPAPHSDVYDIPAWFWPPEDTPLVPETMGAEEVWNECKRNNRNRKSEKRRDPNLSNSARDENDCSPSSMIETYEMERALHKLERFPSEWREDALLEMRQDFSEQDYQIIETKSPDRNQKYVNGLKKTYLDRGLGLAPDSNNPSVLARELKHRVEISETGISSTVNETKDTSQHHHRRKQQFPHQLK